MHCVSNNKVITFHELLLIRPIINYTKIYYISSIVIVVMINKLENLDKITILLVRYVMN